MTDTDRLIRLGRAFTFLVRTETYAVNRAALILQREFGKGFDEADNAELWEAAYSIVSHSAILSKIFFPVEKAREVQERGKLMRTLFEVSGESPLSAWQVRNGFEHIDERIHDWMDDGWISVIDQFTGTSEQLSEHSQSLIFRNFNHETGVVTIGKDSVNLRDLSRESDRLYFRWREIEGLPPHPEVQMPGKPGASAGSSTWSSV